MTEIEEEDHALLELAALTIDCPDSARVGDSYHSALGGTIIHRDEDSLFLQTATLLLIFRRVSYYRAPTWPSPDVPLQTHFEFVVDDPAQAVVELISISAHRAMCTEHARIDDADDSAPRLTTSGYGYAMFIGNFAGHAAWYHPGDNPAICPWLVGSLTRRPASSSCSTTRRSRGRPCSASCSRSLWNPKEWLCWRGCAGGPTDETLALGPGPDRQNPVGGVGSGLNCS